MSSFVEFLKRKSITVLENWILRNGSSLKKDLKQEKPNTIYLIETNEIKPWRKSVIQTDLKPYLLFLYQFYLKIQNDESLDTNTS